MMNEMTVYLRPHSSFLRSQPPRSDTLFGAMCWGYRVLFGNDALEEVLAQFRDTSVPFLISSMFRYIGQDGEKEHIFPKPYTAPLDLLEHIPNPGLQELDAAKRVRNMRDVKGQDFSDILHGNKNDRAFFKQLLQEGYDHPGTISQCSLSPPVRQHCGVFFCMKYQKDRN